MLQSLTARTSAAARVERKEEVWRLSLGGQGSGYQLAQLDDYSALPRRQFLHRPPFHLHLRARASHSALPGTWGFGVWNDPFGFSLGFGGRPMQLPALPNAAWFFFASPENHLALQNSLPGNGPMAAVFSAPRLPGLLMAPAALALPLLAVPASARWLRAAASKLIAQDAVALNLDPAEWHSYELIWHVDGVEFKVDGVRVLRCAATPRPPLGLVLWLDTQYMAWLPSGQLRSGTQAALADSWLELEDVQVH